MKFKTAVIDIRFHRESGTDRSGRYSHGETYLPRYIQNLFPGHFVDLSPSGVAVIRLEIRSDNSIVDGELYYNGAFMYAFPVDGTVKPEYTVVRFYYEGFYFVLEYRFLNRENS
jgi:hypothetical protein